MTRYSDAEPEWLVKRYGGKKGLQHARKVMPNPMFSRLNPSYSELLEMKKKRR